MKQNPFESIEEKQDILIDLVAELATRIRTGNPQQINPVVKESIQSHYLRKELMKKFNCSYVTIHNMEKKGIIKGKRIGKRVYYLKSEIDALFEDK